MPPILPSFLRAFLLGLAVAVPLGPTGAAAIRVGLERGAWASFGIGVGAAATDFVYIVGVYLGLTRLLVHFTWLPPVLYAVGTLALGRMGFRAVRSGFMNQGMSEPLLHSDETASKTSTAGSWRVTVLLGVAITIVNPATITSWLSIGGAFVASSLADLSTASSFLVMLGVFVGSATWFSVLTLGVSMTRVLSGRIPQLFRIVTIGSGVVLLLFAVFFVEQGIRSLHLPW